MRYSLQVALMVQTVVLVGCSTSMDNPVWPTPLTPSSVTSIAVSGYNGDITSLGQTVQLKATATMSHGGSVDVTNAASWASDVTGVARVSSSGVVTSVSAGDATITATLNGVVGRQRITVRPSA